LEPFAGGEFLGRRFQSFAARALKVVNGLNFLKTPFELLQLSGKRFRIGLASFLVFDKLFLYPL
jgi:hypothetical protein